MTACTQSRYCCVLSELLGAPVLFNMYSVENSFAAISLSQNIAVCPSLPQNKDTLSHPEDTAICSRSVTPSSPRGVEVGLSHHPVPPRKLVGLSHRSVPPRKLASLDSTRPSSRGGLLWGRGFVRGLTSENDSRFRIFSNIVYIPLKPFKANRRVFFGQVLVLGWISSSIKFHRYMRNDRAKASRLGFEEAAKLLSIFRFQ